MTSEDDRVEEAQLLLRQSLRLLDEHPRGGQAERAGRTLRELAADLARDAAETLCHDDPALEEAMSEEHSRGWAG